MAKVHGKATAVFYGAFNHSNYYRNSEPTFDAGLSDVTCYGDGGTKTVPGLRDGSITLEGLFDGAADAIDEELAADFQAAAGRPLSISPSGSFAVGERVWFCNTRIANYSVNAPIADVVSMDAEFASEAGVFSGVALHAHTAESASSNSTSVDNAASTANGAVAALHVTSVSASDSIVVKVQHSTDNSVWVDLITFTSAAAATSEFLSVTGTVNRYVRSLWTVTGAAISIPFVVSVARLNN